MAKKKPSEIWYKLVNLYNPKQPFNNDELRQTQFRPFIELLILHLRWHSELEVDVPMDPFVFKRRRAILELIKDF
jgi:hypothetical protein